jgi:hypothetical protein
MPLWALERGGLAEVDIVGRVGVGELGLCAVRCARDIAGS